MAMVGIMVKKMKCSNKLIYWDCINKIAIALSSLRDNVIAILLILYLLSHFDRFT